MMRRSGRGAAGFTLVEVSIALLLFVLVIVKGVMIFNMAQRSQDDDSTEMLLDSQARAVLDRIAYALMGADRDSLTPDPSAPVYSPNLRYRVSLGVEEGEIVWGGFEAIQLGESSEDGQSVLWLENPGSEAERRAVWCSAVRPFLEGEYPNGKDDNGNGLIDERGLSFTLEQGRVVIQLSIEKQKSDGSTFVQTVESAVRIRN